LISLTLNSCNLFISGSPKGPRKHERSVSDAKKIIFILNGLWQNSETFNHTIQNLLAAFKAEGLTVEIKSLVEPSTSARTVDEQAGDAFEVMKQYLAGGKYEIILVGHSQGGLRGAQILSLNKQKGNPLDIRGLITLGTPWEGAPGAAITKSSVEAFLNKKPVTYCLTGVNYVRPLGDMFTSGTIGKLFDNHFPSHEPGIQDMKPNSEFLQSLAASLASNDIPILAVAGVNREAKSFLYRGDETYTRYIHKVPRVVFNSFYSRVLAGGWNTEHDMVVPLNSQLAKNIDKSNTFETHIVKGAIHDFLPGLLIPPDKIIYNHIEVVQLIVEFTKRNCGFAIA
jgi:pimeloyl-ACP methyl ester carboxylesterase